MELTVKMKPKFRIVARLFDGRTLTGYRLERTDIVKGGTKDVSKQKVVELASQGLILHAKANHGELTMEDGYKMSDLPRINITAGINQKNINKMARYSRKEILTSEDREDYNRLLSDAINSMIRTDDKCMNALVDRYADKFEQR